MLKISSITYLIKESILPVCVILSFTLGLLMMIGPLENAMAQDLKLKNIHTTLNLTLHNVPMEEALKAVATQAQFNIVLGNDLTRLVNLDFKGVSVEDVLLSLKQMGQLYYYVENDTLFVTTRQSTASNGVKQLENHFIQVKHLPAGFVADYLNATLFSYVQNASTSSSLSQGNNTLGGTGTSSTGTTSGSGNPQNNLIAIADPITNTVIVRTDAQEAQEAARLVSEIDVQRPSKTWRLNFQRADEVATALVTALFSNGSTPPLMINNGGGASNGGTNANSGGNASSNTGTNANGGGSSSNGNNTSASNTSGSSGNNNTGTTSSNSKTNIGSQAGKPISISTEGIKEGQGTSNDHTLRSRPIQNAQATVSSNGPIILPDTRINTITIFATPQQLAKADEFIEEFDRQRQQVYIEMAIIEMSDSLDKILTPSIEAKLNKVNLGFNANGTGQSFATYLKNPIQNTSNFNAVLNFLNVESKLKVISRPSVLVLNNEEATIKIEDEVIQGFTDVRDQNNNIVARVAQQASAGIVLHVRSRIGANGDISLMVQPQFSFPQKSNTGEIQLISSRAWLTENVILKEGQSFVIAGLTQSTDRQRNNKIPVVGDIPFLKGLSNTYDGSHKNQEMIIMLTPRLVDNGQQFNATASKPSIKTPNIKEELVYSPTLLPKTRSTSTDKVLEAKRPPAPIADFQQKSYTLPSPPQAGFYRSFP